MLSKFLALVCRIFGHRWYALRFYGSGEPAGRECVRCGLFEPPPARIGVDYRLLVCPGCGV